MFTRLVVIVEKMARSDKMLFRLGPEFTEELL